MIYADNAATTKLSGIALNAMLPYLREAYGNPSSLYSLGQQAAEALAEARQTMADCLHCRPEEIYFTSGGSEADNQAILSAARRGKARGKTHIISTSFEHHAVLHTLQKLDEAITDDTCLVTIMYANNEIGTIQPIADIGRLCRERNVLFHTDAVQAAGHLEIDVGRENIDMLSLSGHKFHGPKGVGALYVRKGIPLTPLIEGGAQERRKRAGTENVAGIVGMAAALKEACDHLPEHTAKVSALRDKLIAGLEAIPHGALNGDRNHRLPGNVSFCFEGIEGESMLLLLDDRGICASSGSACTSGSLDPSHVLLAIGRPHEVAHGSLRLSLCEENTEQEVDVMLREIPQVIDYLRNMSPVWRKLQKGECSYVIQ